MVEDRTTVGGSADERCALCLLTDSPDGVLGRAGLSVAYTDDDLVGLVPVELPGVYVAPRAHVGALFGVPGLAAVVLAALRRVVEEVKSSYGVADAAVEPVTQVPSSEGHLCYHVRPVVPDDGASAWPDLPARAERLAACLRRPAAPFPPVQR